MIDNIELIKPLLTFEKKDDFHMLYIFKRKKDQLRGEKENSQSVRTIKSYCIHSLGHLEERYSEIKDLCEYFKARCYIHIQTQNHRDVGLNMMIELATRLKDGATNQRNLFDSVVGQVKVVEKSWIVDIDNTDPRYENFIIDMINVSQPKENKVIAKIPTKNGLHLISKPFNVQEFNKYVKVRTDTIPDIQKKNPTLLYYPNSLELC